MRDCIVLGAGMAGIAAARDLAVHHRRDVLVLEARGRIGGRVESLRDWTSLPVELGAEYVHVARSAVSAAFWGEIDRHGFTTQRISKRMNGWVFFDSWPIVKLWRVIQACDDAEIRPMIRLFGDLARAIHSPDVSARVWIDAYRPGGLPLPLWGRGLRMAEYALSGHLPATLDDLSVHGFLNDGIPAQLATETHDFVLQDAEGRRCGYDSLIQAMARELPPGALELEAPVARVRRVPGGVVAETRDGRVHEARALISTLPVGVLKRAGADVFGDILTDRKRAALRLVDMGPVTKVIMAFERRFWRKSMGILSHPDSRTRGFFNVFPGLDDAPAVLTAYLVGPDAAEMAAVAAADPRNEQGLVLRRVLRQLARIYPRAGLDADAKREDLEADNGVLKWRMKAWADDPYAGGGYSYLKVAGPGDALSVLDARAALKNATDTRPVFWAGEATAPAYDAAWQPSSVHGAYVSGVGAAREVNGYLASA
jgi:monoamine oxidase